MDVFVLLASFRMRITAPILDGVPVTCAKSRFTRTLRPCFASFLPSCEFYKYQSIETRASRTHDSEFKQVEATIRSKA